MSKGNKAVKVRLSPDVLAAIEEEIERHKKNYFVDADYSVSDFIRAAISDKIKHRRRGRRQKKGKPQMVEINYPECTIRTTVEAAADIIDANEMMEEVLS